MPSPESHTVKCECIDTLTAATDNMKRLRTKRKVLLGVLLVTMLLVSVVQILVVFLYRTTKLEEEKTHLISLESLLNVSTGSQGGSKGRPKMKLRLLSKKAVNKTGAYCLDGTLPGYYFQPGVGDGQRSWVIYLPGGEACFTLDACRKRAAQTRGLGPGSTGKLSNTTKGHGIRSTNKTINPDFWDWNMVEVVYCDGFTFSGDRSDVVVYNEKKLYFRGKRILQAVIGELLKKGLDKATDVILHGFSAGAMAVLKHASWVQNKLRKTVNFKIFVASVAFPMLPNVHTGKYFNETTLIPAIMMHHAARSAPKSCLREADPSGSTMKCHEPFNLLHHQEADMFVAGYVYDAWELDNTLEAKCTPKTCKKEVERNGLQNLSHAILETLPRIIKPQDGIYMINCKKHFITTEHNTWSNGLLVDGVTPAKAFTDWYYGRGGNHRHIDCVTFDCYPNPTCGKARL